jgi:hypothetical protein
MFAFVVRLHLVARAMLAAVAPGWALNSIATLPVALIFPLLFFPSA